MRWCLNVGENEMRRTRQITGQHVVAIFVAFFGLVIAVNFTMARYAVATFGGTVVDNSYVASQKFNRWIAEADREKKLGWTVADPIRDGDFLEISARDALSKPLTGASVSMRAEHPLGRMPERDLWFVEVSPGTYRSNEALPSGRWKLRVLLRQADRRMKLAFEVN